MNTSRQEPRTLLFLAAVLFLGPTLVGCEPPPAGSSETEAVSAPYIEGATSVEAGRYLVIVGGCNDCHTENYLQTEGDVPEDQWLTGSALGWRGPWGTTYPPNLRLTASEFSEDEWVALLRERKALPPMPWMNVNQITETDSRNLHRYLRSLGVAGSRAPTALPPDQEPATPYLSLMPVEPGS